MAIIELEYHPAAANEVVGAKEWYASIDLNVAQKFMLEVAHAERLIARSPESWGTYLHGTKGFRFRGFPFVMAFIMRQEKVLVVALAHTRRRPGYWKQRML